MESFNKNDKQSHFNKIKGELVELNDAEKYCSITLLVGHEKPRKVNFSTKKPKFDEISQTFNIGDRVSVFFFPTSNFANGRYYHANIVLDVEESTIN